MRTRAPCPQNARPRRFQLSHRAKRAIGGQARVQRQLIIAGRGMVSLSDASVIVSLSAQLQRGGSFETDRKFTFARRPFKRMRQKTRQAPHRLAAASLLSSKRSASI